MLLLTFFISIASSIPIETTPTFSEIQATSLNINYPISLPKISLETGGSFLVVGDFGYQSLTDYWYSQKTNQQKVAEAMISLSKIHKPNFVISVGDNFYRGGQYQYTDGVIDVKDGRFNDFWKNVYIKGNLSNVPWFVVLGNHDWVGNIEAQVEYSTHSKMWNMPDLFYETNFKVPSSLCKDPKCNPNANFIFIDTNFLTYGYFSDLEYTASIFN